MASPQFNSPFWLAKGPDRHLPDWKSAVVAGRSERLRGRDTAPALPGRGQEGDRSRAGHLARHRNRRDLDDFRCDNGPIDEFDINLRNLTYGQFVELGHAPTAAQVAGLAGSTDEEVRGGWRRLHDAHALTLNPSTAEIRMASPFSAVPTAYRVHAADRWWYANCAWDAFGIFGALHADGRIEASCPDCGEAITIEVHDERPDDTTLLFHCLLPASRWWNDIVFT